MEKVKKRKIPRKQSQENKKKKKGEKRDLFWPGGKISSRGVFAASGAQEKRKKDAYNIT